MATKPTLTNASIAEALGVSIRRVSQLKVAGMPTNSLEAALAWREAQEQKPGDGGTDELRREKIALVRAQRERI
ncbi:MAG: hypothetical protein EOP85_20690, partial [Verrucomicrobiaceae bacterium]